MAFKRSARTAPCPFLNFSVKITPLIKDVLSAGNAIVAMLLSHSNHFAHAVMIYNYDDINFKIKDSHGEKYEIPIEHPEITRDSCNWILYPYGLTFEFKCHSI